MSIICYQYLLNVSEKSAYGRPFLQCLCFFQLSRSLYFRRHLCNGVTKLFITLRYYAFIFWRSLLFGIVMSRLSQAALITHGSQSGVLDLHTFFACVISHMCAPYLYLLGVVLFTVIDALPSSKLSAQPSLHNILNT